MRISYLVFIRSRYSLNFSSPETSYYGSCGEGSPGSSSGFLDDLIEIKDENLDDDDDDRSSKVIADVSLNPSSLSGYIEKVRV